MQVSSGNTEIVRPRGQKHIVDQLTDWSITIERITVWLHDTDVNRPYRTPIQPLLVKGEFKEFAAKLSKVFSHRRRNGLKLEIKIDTRNGQKFVQIECHGTGNFLHWLRKELLTAKDVIDPYL